MTADSTARVQIQETVCRNIITKSKLAEYAVNPYIGCEHACAYCYACYMTTFSGHAEPWGSYVDVKNWPEIRKPEKYAGKSIAVGSVTDPYQPAEAQYGRTRMFLEQMRDSGARIGIMTKSDLIVRDLDLLQSIPGTHVTFSINTMDEDLRREMDRAVPIAKRIDAMRTLHDAGIETTCFIAPVMPALTGVPSIILAVQNACDMVYVDRLNLRGANRQTVLRLIQEKHPEHLELYRAIYGHGDCRYWDALHCQLQKFAEREGLAYVHCADGQTVPGRMPKILNFSR